MSQHGFLSKKLRSRFSRVVVVVTWLGSIAAAARADSYNPASFGAKYGTADAASAAVNDAAVVKAMRRLISQGGGELVITGSLALSKTIPWPTAVYAKTPGFPMHFAIRGTADAELYAINGGVLIDVPQPKAPANLPGLDVRQRIENIGIRGGAVKLDGGGKYLSLRGVRIYGLERGTALTVTNYDGGLLEANIHNNPGATGFHFIGCHQVQLDITSRINTVGGIMDDCGALSGRVYCEANSGLGIVLNGLCRSNLCWWLEANNKDRMQGRRRLCWGNVFYGMMQTDSNEAWDDDSLSRLGNQVTSSPTVLTGLGELVAKAVPGRTQFPKGVEMAGETLTIRPDTFQAYSAPSGQPNWIELKPADRDDCGGTWQPGDVFVVSIKIVPDAAARAWFLKNEKVQFLFGAGSNAGTAPYLSQRWSPEGSDHDLVMFGPCTKAGSGFRLFLYPQVGSEGAGPDKELTFTMQAEVRKLPPR
ncbi:MAG TPA: hypothetical protein VHD36_11540 [Pirellulales bacterium]|nr:hypothetical protein [Pirellulales bacterium]